MKKFLFSLLIFAAFFSYKKWDRISLWWALQASQAPWVQEQLALDFSPFQEITQEALDQTFQKVQEADVYAYRYRIVNGEIFRKGSPDKLGRAHQFEKILKRIHRSKKLPDLDFIICMNDGVPEGYMAPDFWFAEKQAPLLSWAKRKNLARYVVLIPDFLNTKEASWHKEIETVNERYRSIPWKERKQIAFWRGASNDKGYTLENYREKPRFLISWLSHLHPDQIDAGFCRVHPPEVADVVQQLGLILGNTPVADHLFYKYLPVLDGHMCTFPGFQWRLLSGSLTLKQESDEVQYFYGAIKPYEHYLPLKRDMSDLLEKIAWAKEHDSECQAMSVRARTFALAHLMPNHVYAYLYWVLQRHAALQTFNLANEPMTPDWEKRT